VLLGALVELVMALMLREELMVVMVRAALFYLQ
jgi:hypothetical protein